MRKTDVKNKASYANPISGLTAAAGELTGEVILGWNAVKNASGYTVEIGNEKENEQWEQVDFVKNPKCIITGLTPGNSYMFKVSSVCTSGSGRLSGRINIKL